MRATNGNTHLGGDDLDSMIVDWILAEIAGEDKSKLQTDLFALAKLRGVAEKAKIDLSVEEKVLVQIPDLLSPNSNLRDLSLMLTRSQLESMAEDFIAQTLIPCRQALQDSKVASWRYSRSFASWRANTNASN